MRFDDKFALGFSGFEEALVLWDCHGGWLMDGVLGASIVGL